MVLAYDGREDTLRCLDSLTRGTWSPLTVMVVDNGSRDGTTAEVRLRYPDVAVFREEENLGFAEGNNVGIRQALAAGADFVLLLNNDTTVAPDTIARCVEAAELHPDAAAVCPLIFFAEPSNLIWYAGARFDPRRAHGGRVIGYREVDKGQYSGQQETERATGAAVLLRRRALEHIGLLDPDLFFLYEDVDWSLRARRAGYQIYFTPEAKVWHRVSASAGGEHSALIGYYDTRNHVVTCRRYAPLGGSAALARELGILAIHLAAARRARHRVAYLRGVIQGWRDARRGRMGLRP